MSKMFLFSLELGIWIMGPLESFTVGGAGAPKRGNTPQGLEGVNPEISARD